MAKPRARASKEAPASFETVCKGCGRRVTLTYKTTKSRREAMDDDEDTVVVWIVAEYIMPNHGGIPLLSKKCERSGYTVTRRWKVSKAVGW